MCHRYAYIPSSRAWLASEQNLGPAAAAQLKAMQTLSKVAPSAMTPIVIRDLVTPEAQVILARWGFIPDWWKKATPPQKTINAPWSEVSSRKIWLESWRNHRCLVPASTWYEWQHLAGSKVRRSFRHEEHEGFMFAGLWSKSRDVTAGGETLLTYAILTTDTEDGSGELRARRPIVLSASAWEEWLDPAVVDSERIKILVAENSLRGFSTSNERTVPFRDDTPESIQVSIPASPASVVGTPSTLCALAAP